MTKTEYYGSLRALARRVRKEHGLTTPRVMLTDLRRIYKAYDLKVRLWKAPLKGVRGSYLNDDLGAEVMVNGNLPTEQRIFTMAHELKHHLVDEVGAVNGDAPYGDPIEVGAEIFAAELIYPEQDYIRDLQRMDITPANFTPDSIVHLKRRTRTTLSFTSLAKRAEFLGYAAKGSLAKIQWKKLEESLYGEPEYKRIQRFRARKTSQARLSR